MKALFCLLIFTTLSCSNQPKRTPVLTLEIDNSNYYIAVDTILIERGIRDSLQFGKADFNEIIGDNPDFFQIIPNDPDQTYFSRSIKGEFGSEAGRDIYYLLYAHFLKQKNGDKKYVTQRKKIIEIYLNINSLFAKFQYGGTYFGHQEMKILGYAEYAIYLLSKEKNEVDRTYNFTKQKDLYIKSLRQLIIDQSEIDFNTLGINKVKRNKNFNEILDELDRLITDNFYLRRAQGFHYGHYEYY